MLRILHTSDWHLGHTLRGEVSREPEHAAFLAWLLDACVAERVDALLITGDVFDSATPPASAEAMWFDFLAEARARMPAMSIIAIAGNHDSPARLSAPAAVLRALNVHIVGSLPRFESGALDLDRVLLPVGVNGEALVAAVPFLRPIDFVDAAAEDPLAGVYADVIAAARARRGAEQALIVTGHLYAAGADAQFLSERRVSVGGQESASLRMFPKDVTYVALGHIHKPQKILRDTIRYAGAPLPLYLDEHSYPHQVVVIDFEGTAATEIRSLRIPRTVDVVRVPARGAAPLADALAGLRQLPAMIAGEELWKRPYLEVVIALERPEPKLRALVEQALEGKWPRLVQLHVEMTGHGEALGDRVAMQRLAELDPRDVFARLWARDHAEAPADEVRLAFDRLLEEVQGDREDLVS